MLRVVKHLDGIVENHGVERSTLLPQGLTCVHCGCPQYGHLDESRLHIVPGSYTRMYTRKHVYTYAFGPGFQSQTPRTRQRISVYEMQHAIVKDGLFTRQQLRSCRFTEHMLEVNDASFYDSRPFSCECQLDLTSSMKLRWLITSQGLVQVPDYTNLTIGDTAQSLGSGVVDDPLPIFDRTNEVGNNLNYRGLTPAESRFIAGEKIRTGKRRRSPAAAQRRGLARKERKLLRNVSPLPKSSPVKGLSSVNPDVVLNLTFRYKGVLKPHIFRSTEARRCKSTLIGRQDRSFHATTGMTPKDGYFLRKNGSFYRSLHAPLGASRGRQLLRRLPVHVRPP